MIDWNGNGKIDPVDIGISEGLHSDSSDDTEFIDIAEQKNQKDTTGAKIIWIVMIVLLLIGAISILFSR